MRLPRHHKHSPAPARPNIGIPDEQARALDRRRALDDQQRAFQGEGTKPARTRRPT